MPSFAELVSTSIGGGGTDDDDDDGSRDESQSLLSSSEDSSSTSSGHSYSSHRSETTRGGGSSSSGDDNKSKSTRSTKQSEIADKLSRVVARWRFCVIIMLLTTTILVVSSTYVFLSNSQEQEYQKSFEKSAKSIMDSVEFHATNAVKTFETLADSLTAEALTANATWPFFTADHFEIKAAHARLNAFAECVLFMPLVMGDDRDQRKQWEAYSVVQASTWLTQSLVLGMETSKWLNESNYYDYDYYSSKNKKDDDDEEEKGHVGTTSGRRLLQQRRLGSNRELQVRTERKTELTTFVIFQEEEATEQPAIETTAPTTTTSTSSGPTPAPTTTTARQQQQDIPEPVFTIADEIYLKGEDLPGGTDGDLTIISESWRPYYAPVWQISPPPHKPTLINYNLLADATSGGTFHAIQVSGHNAIVSELLKTSSIDFFYQGIMTTDEHWGYHSSSDAAGGGGNGNNGKTSPGNFPHSTTIAPIHSNFDPESPIVGFVAGIAPWDLYLSRLLPEGTNGIYAVLSNSCAQVVTYKITGQTAIYLGPGDLHEPTYDNLQETLSLAGFGLSTEASRRAGQCDYFLALYPSEEYRSDYQDNKPTVFTAILALVFLATGVVFFIFAIYVQRRQQTIMNTALRTNAIVSSLFPANVRARILKDAEDQMDNNKNYNDNTAAANGRSDTRNLKKYLKDAKEEANKSYAEPIDDDEEVINTNIFGSKPIADLFPETTLMFADLVGFTAWSSMREPTQVFTLLETVYHSFDQLANKRRVFKVETVGDCYVAVTGVPEPRKDHAVVMCRFAKDCLDKLKPMLKKLEVVLGPDTGDLSMRFGLHSGSVTAGVLRGERARFQLFGDTMNTCSRIESTGRTGYIHISQQTADLLKGAGKEYWYVPRKDKVHAKGKGELQTYWLVFKQQDGSSMSSGNSESEGADEDEADVRQSAPAPAANEVSANVPHPLGPAQEIKPVKLSKKGLRLVDWNVDILSRLLKQIVARREADGGKTLPGDKLEPIEREFKKQWYDGTVMDEVREIIQLPKFDNEATRKKEQLYSSSIKLSQEAVDQLRSYVTILAGLYRDSVPFHNFEHASHVTMSVVKLLSRIVAPKSTDDHGDADKERHDHTYGIASDPLTQFAVVISALIHDVDHVGVPNAQLVKENAAICARYNNKSVAEQNSVDISWNLLMQPAYNDLRATIYSSKEELSRFRQLVVNTVLATDIVDRELKELRNARWDRAFYQKEQQLSEQIVQPDSVYNDDATNRKATIVIEHIIQASDIAHTMQHWHIYRKWNERFFEENMLAYQTGRSEKDPSEYWYKGEIGFFDFYIIPLAKKLEECGVFGVSSHEYKQYAENNRLEWIQKGEQVVAEMRAKYFQQVKEAQSAVKSPHT